jgi:hypothetical protein
MKSKTDQERFMDVNLHFKALSYMELEKLAPIINLT